MGCVGLIKKAIIIGCGGHAHAVGAALHALNVTIHGYLDSSFNKDQVETIKHGTLIGTLEHLNQLDRQEYEVYVAVGDNQKRYKIIEKITAMGFAMPPLIHPKSTLESDCQFGAASFVCLGAILATEVKLGKGVIINTGSSIDHESSVGDYTHIAPNVTVAGRAHIGKSVFIGMGASIAQGIVVEDGAIIGAGAIVLKDVPERAKILGVYH